VATLVGRRIGEGRPDLGARSTWIASILSTAYMSVFIVIYLVAPDAILAPYAYYSHQDDFAAIHSEVVLLLRFVAFYSLFDALAVVFSSAIRGAGDTQFALVFNVVSGVILMVLPTAYVYWKNPSVFLAWMSLTAYITVLAFGYLARFLGGKWRSMRVIEGPNELEAEAQEPAEEPEAVACAE
jgi:MATE family multidrug resistance protein